MRFRSYPSQRSDRTSIDGGVQVPGKIGPQPPGTDTKQEEPATRDTAPEEIAKSTGGG